jgi:hypothetical protein
MGKLFKKAKDWQHNSFVNNSHDKWLNFSMGYLRAAKIIEQNLIDKMNDRDSLIFPLMYLHRHYLELAMKEIIVLTKELNGEFDFKPSGGHDLMHLWKESQACLSSWSEDYEPPNKSVEGKIKEFHSLDFKSDGFRYPIDKKGDKNLKNIPIINYRNFRDEFLEVELFLEGIIDGLYVARDEIGFVRNARQD